MYVIVEKSKNRLYTYIEEDAVFKRMEKERSDLKKLPASVLEDECDLGDLPNNSYITFKLAGSKQAKKPTKKKKSRAT